jgi:hypothetical protein
MPRLWDERDRTAPRLTEWSTLAEKLREQGIISDDYTEPATVETNVIPIAKPRPHRRAWLVGLRVAAGLVFAAGFGALGRMSAGVSAAPSGRDLAYLAGRIVGDSVLPPSLEKIMNQQPPFNSTEDALTALAAAQRNYDRAVSFLAVHDTTTQSPEAGDVFRTRLAALDEMAETSREALSAAPADPVLNQYYLSTLGAREVTLRQLGSVLTPGKRIVRF